MAWVMAFCWAVDPSAERLPVKQVGPAAGEPPGESVEPLLPAGALLPASALAASVLAALPQPARAIAAAAASPEARAMVRDFVKRSCLSRQVLVDRSCLTVGSLDDARSLPR